MTREIMKEIKDLIAKGHSGHEIVAMGYAESTVRKVGDMMALRGELPGVRESIREELWKVGNAEVLKQVRRELREKGFKQGSINAVVSELRKKGYLTFEAKDLRLAEVLSLSFADAFNLIAAMVKRVEKENEALEDRVKVLEKGIEARDSLLKKLMNRINQPIKQDGGESEGPTGKAPVRKYDWEKIGELSKLGFTHRQISEETGAPVHRVQKILRKLRDLKSRNEGR